MSSFCSRVGDCVSNATGTALWVGLSSVGAGTVSWLGYSVTQVGFAAGTGLGAVGLLSTLGASAIFEKFICSRGILQSLASLAVGTAATYGASVGAAALGIIAAPVTVPTALILTISSLATLVLLATCFGEKQNKRPERASDLTLHQQRTGETTKDKEKERVEKDDKNEEAKGTSGGAASSSASSTTTPPEATSGSADSTKEQKAA